MIANVDYFGRSELEYYTDILAEARRDLVYVMNLRVGAESFKCTAEELPSFLERATQHLLDGGAIVGRAEPDTVNWTVAPEFAGYTHDVGKRIVAAWLSDRAAFDARAFIVREVEVRVA